ncbi:amino acid permease [Streptacidiphilus sp. N1-3]|uniref:Amino acid permease n=1 Tax=Streptacidiphilus alkalitolerans TaxID=3342712 RepID=A0ABV6XAQ8_9ACTN
MSRSAHSPIPLADDSAVLERLGIEPQLTRRMSPFGNFAVSFSVISILSGCMTLYGFGLNTGGPAVMLLGWGAVGLAVLTVGLSLAEVTSAYPASGALFDMAGRLGGPGWSWLTGWLNMLGLLGGIAGIDYGAAQFTGTLLTLQFGYTPAPWRTMGIFAAILLLHAVVNLFNVSVVSLLNGISVWWHIVGVAVIFLALILVPSHHQSVDWVFTHYVNNTGWHNPIYVTAIGLLLAQYTFSGYDASAHLAEETTSAQQSAPRGIVRSISVSWIAGFFLLFALTYAIQDYAGTLHTSTGVPPAQIFLDALGSTGAKILLLIVVGAQLFCGAAETAASSRMIFAFSRDGALPFSHRWRRTSASGTPRAAVWLSVCLAALLALPSVYSPVAYGAITAINVVGITPAYAIPIALRLRRGKSFEPGPWSLGRWSVPLNVFAVVWVAFVTVLVCLPQSAPVTRTTANYAPVALAVALAISGVWWLVGRRSYVPPQVASPRQADVVEAGIV